MICIQHSCITMNRVCEHDMTRRVCKQLTSDSSMSSKQHLDNVNPDPPISHFVAREGDRCARDCDPTPPPLLSMEMALDRASCSLTNHSCLHTQHTSSPTVSCQ